MWVCNYKNFLYLKNKRGLLNYIPPFNYTVNSVSGIIKKIPTRQKSGTEPLINLSDGSEINLKTTHKNLIIYLVGETTRAQNLSFNGYERNTTEFLTKEKDNIINFGNFWSNNRSGVE
jgi:lipid A ethanolaminephosphotransferase